MKISLTKLSTKNLATLAQRVITSSSAGNYQVISGHPLLATLQTAFADYDAVYTKQIYSGKGADVATADDDRDAAYRNLKAFLNGYRKLTSAANWQAAEDLYQIFNVFGLDIDRLSYSSQSAQMKKLIEAMELPDNFQKIAQLSLQVGFGEMKMKHDAFEVLFAEQAEANADLRNMASASAIRRDLEQTLKSYLNLITAMKDVAGWELFYADVNEHVKAAKNSTNNAPPSVNP